MKRQNGNEEGSDGKVNIDIMCNIRQLVYEIYLLGSGKLLLTV